MRPVKLSKSMFPMRRNVLFASGYCSKILQRISKKVTCLLEKHGAEAEILGYIQVPHGASEETNS